MKRWAKALLLLAAMLCLALPALAEADVGRGATGDAVVEIQTRLNQLGYEAGSADGQYGGRTEDAVKQFQKINGLEETGVVDEATRACLFSEDALDAAGRSAPADPDVVLVQRQLRLPRKSLLMLDDLKPGFDMARASGVTFAAAGWANDIPEIEAFMRAHCDFYFKTVPELGAFLFD